MTPTVRDVLWLIVGILAGAWLTYTPRASWWTRCVWDHADDDPRVRATRDGRHDA